MKEQREYCCKNKPYHPGHFRPLLGEDHIRITPVIEMRFRKAKSGPEHELACSGRLLHSGDTSPQRAPGAANYVVTAVTYGTQRRYGRKLIAGVMSGRDPALLPGCP
jgi:hypothetical protein